MRGVIRENTPFVEGLKQAAFGTPTESSRCECSNHVQAHQPKWLGTYTFVEATADDAGKGSRGEDPARAPAVLGSIPPGWHGSGSTTEFPLHGAHSQVQGSQECPSPRSRNHELNPAHQVYSLITVRAWLEGFYPIEVDQGKTADPKEAGGRELFLNTSQSLVDGEPFIFHRHDGDPLQHAHITNFTYRDKVGAATNPQGNTGGGIEVGCRGFGLVNAHTEDRSL